MSTNLYRLLLISVVTATTAGSHVAMAAQKRPSSLPRDSKTEQQRSLPVEIFPVLELPVIIHEASLTRNGGSYSLNLSIGNTSGATIIGMRYSLVVIEGQNKLRPLVNRTEGFSVAGYSARTLTLKFPIAFKPKGGERLLMMLEQVISRESIWEVVKAKDALEAYAKGDFSVMPAVLRVSNQVDAPLIPRKLFRQY